MASNELGNVQCILCKAHVNFTQGGKETFYKHLKSEHDIFFNQDLVMAVNFLDKDTTQQIVQNFDSQYSLIINEKKDDANVKKEDNEILLKEPGEMDNENIIVLDDESNAAVEDDIIQIDDESNENVSEQSKSKMAIFVCSLCNETCESKEMLLAHVKSHKKYKSQKIENKQKQSISCNDISCNETFYEQSDLIKHTDSIHKPIKTPIALNPKEETKNGATANACPICEKVVKNLKTHTEDVHSTGHFPCPKCKKVFTSKNKQSSHTSRNCRKTADLNKSVPTISKHNRQSRRKSTGSLVMVGASKLKQIKAQVMEKNVMGQDKIKNTLNLARLSNLSISKSKLESSTTEIKTETRSRSMKKANIETVTTRSRQRKVAMKVNKKISKNKLSKKISGSKRRSGVGTACPICQKVVGHLERHTLDIHSPAGHFPCPGCKKVFSSKNKQSSHTSRNCNPNKPRK